MNKGWVNYMKITKITCPRCEVDINWNPQNRIDFCSFPSLFINDSL